MPESCLASAVPRDLDRHQIRQMFAQDRISFAGGLMRINVLQCAFLFDVIVVR